MKHFYTLFPLCVLRAAKLFSIEHRVAYSRRSDSSFLQKTNEKGREKKTTKMQCAVTERKRGRNKDTND